ncbi:MAG: hypothetical protein ACQ9MH_23020 [Nitrospinales bacterium]
MNPETTFFERHRKLFLLSFLIFATYHFIGIFPVAPIEGDGIGMANGASVAAYSGLSPNPISYSYYGRSGTYVLIDVLCKLTKLDPFILLSVLSGLSFVIFVIFSGLLLSEITKYPFSACSLCILMFPETAIGGYYANNTVIAAAFAIPSLYVLKVCKQKKFLFLAAILFGLGAWIRLDVILLSPVFIVLLHSGNFKHTVYKTILVGAVAIIVLAIAMNLSNDNIFQILSRIGEHKKRVLTHPRFFDCHLAFFPIILILLNLGGLFYLILKRNWYLLGIVFLAVMPLYIILNKTIVNPRFMYYLIPFFAIPVIYSISQIAFISKKHIFFIAIIVILFFSQYLIGYTEMNCDYRFARTLFKIQNPFIKDSCISARLGLGRKAKITSQTRFLSGLLYGPRWWYYRKREINQELEKLYSYLNIRDFNELNLLTYGWYHDQLSKHVLLHMGYSFHQFRMHNNIRQYIFTKENRKCTVYWLFGDELAAGNYKNIVPPIAPDPILIIGNRGHLKDLFQDVAELKEICSFAYIRLLLNE